LQIQLASPLTIKHSRLWSFGIAIEFKSGLSTSLNPANIYD
jgi:hypothetical protein